MDKELLKADIIAEWKRDVTRLGFPKALIKTVKSVAKGSYLGIKYGLHPERQTAENKLEQDKFKARYNIE